MQNMSRSITIIDFSIRIQYINLALNNKTMPLPISIILYVVGGLYILFAFKNPPKAIEHFFKIPAIFVFLPEKMQVPAGRIAAGILIIGFTAYYQFGLYM